MIHCKLIFVIFILFAFSTSANDVQIIELHKNKSLDQLVLEEQTEIEKKKKPKSAISAIRT